MVTAGVGILAQLASIAMHMLGTGIGMANLGGGDASDAVANMMSGTLGVVSSVIGILIGALIIFGAMKMRQLNNWRVVAGRLHPGHDPLPVALLLHRAADRHLGVGRPVRPERQGLVRLGPSEPTGPPAGARAEQRQRGLSPVVRAAPSDRSATTR